MSVKNIAILKITDGTLQNTINLLAPHAGYHLKSWRQARPDIQYAVGTNWFTGKETPVGHTVPNHVEPFTFAANGINPDNLIELEQKFIRVLMMAARYWSKDPNIKRPFYIVAKMKGETYPRYATILMSKLHSSSNPYAQPFFNYKPADDDLAVVLTHPGWRDFPPGESENITDTLMSELVSKIHVANDRFGPVTWGDTSPEPMYMANYFSDANISHIFRGGSGPNLQETAYLNATHKILLYQPSDGYTYFGTETGAFGYQTTFNNIIFNLWENALTGANFTFEMSVGGAWLPMQAEAVWGNLNLSPSNPVSMVTWKPTHAWETDIVNGVEGYWMRMGGGTVDVYQVGYKPYAISWPYIDVPNPTPGDYGINLDIAVKPGVDPAPQFSETYDDQEPIFNRIIIAAREINDENDFFVPYLSPGLAVMGDYGILWSTSNLADDQTAYGLKVIQPSLLPFTEGSPPSAMSWFQIDYSTAPAYAGRFRVFLRIASGKSILEEGVASFWLDIKDVGGSESRTSKSTRRVTDALSYDHITVLDLGSITLGSDRKAGFGLSGGAVSQRVYIMMQAHEDMSIAQWLNIYDVVLMPQDDWYADVQMSGGLKEVDDELIISSATTPGEISSIVRNSDSLAVEQVPTVSPGLPLHFFTHENIRFYFMTLDDWYVGNDPSNIEQTVGVARSRLKTSFNHFLSKGQFARVAKFLGGRGSKGSA